MLYDTVDGYLRISEPGASVSRETAPTGASLSLLFVDLDLRDVSIDRIAKALQSTSCGHAAVILFRWNDVCVSDQNDRSWADQRVAEWQEQLSKHSVIQHHLRPNWLGVLEHSVGQPLSHRWICTDVEYEGFAHPDAENLINRALRVELNSMMQWGHAVWRPRYYHYEMPSGEHSEVFVKVGDMFRAPRDAFVSALWLADRLEEDQAIVIDNSSILPIVMAAGTLCERRGWKAPVTITLDDYPATRLSLFNAFKSVRSTSDSALTILSVNASGRHLGLIVDASHAILDTADVSHSITVVADKQAQWHHGQVNSGELVTTWLGLSETIPNPLDSATCRVCSASEKPQLVKVDPRSFEALALPGVERVTPDTRAAKASAAFWTACFAADAVGVLSLPDKSPSTAARSNGELMSIRIDLRALLKQLKRDVGPLSRQLQESSWTSELASCDAFIVSKYDKLLPGFDEVVTCIKESLNLPSTTKIVSIDTNQPFSKISMKKRRKLVQATSPIILSVGSVSGWNMRQLLVAVEQCWTEESIKGRPSGIVLHSRPATGRQWKNLDASFSSRLHAVWQTFIPSSSPLVDELKALATVSVGPPMSPAAVRFLSSRRRMCAPSPQLQEWKKRRAASMSDEDVPDPREVLWGLPRGNKLRIRNESLYGTRIDAITAFAAVGAAMHSKRESVERTDPRWRMFDFDSISRSYFDGMLVAIMLRWANPSECWWGSTSHERSGAVLGLVARTREFSDQVVLFPELLLAAYQGKVPREALPDLVSRIGSEIGSWKRSVDRGPVELGLHLASLVDQI